MTLVHGGPLAHYVLERASAPPVIDGDPSEMAAATPIVLTATATNAVATYRLLWDDRALYVGLSVQDEFLNAPTTNHQLWKDDGLEIMFDPDHGHISSLSNPLEHPTHQRRGN